MRAAVQVAIQWCIVVFAAPLDPARRERLPLEWTAAFSRVLTSVFPSAPNASRGALMASCPEDDEHTATILDVIKLHFVDEATIAARHFVALPFRLYPSRISILSNGGFFAVTRHYFVPN
jgi:hypothetical protein